jgi:hypothetical protein
MELLVCREGLGFSVFGKSEELGRKADILEI